MNILFLTLLYHPERVAEVTARSRDGLQNQINNFQWAIIRGLQSAMGQGEQLEIVNALPVGVFPKHYRGLWLPSRRIGERFTDLCCLNLPGIKQWQRKKTAIKALRQWLLADSQNRTVLIYTLYQPYLRAISQLKRQFPDLKATVVVTDLPNELGIASGRTGLLKWIEYSRGRKTMQLCDQMDAFVLLTPPMAEPLRTGPRPCLIMEGIITETVDAAQPIAVPDDPRPAVLYTGTLHRELGIAELLNAFEPMRNVQLWLCGRGDMEAEINAVSKRADHIRYFGFVPQQAALYLQARAEVLINPRSSQGVFTRYSFPSKTLEYMRAGKPVICCKLEGIPDEYDSYLHYIAPQNAEGIQAAVMHVLSMPVAARLDMGARNRAFAINQKSSRFQGKRLYAFLRNVTDPA